MAEKKKTGVIPVDLREMDLESLVYIIRGQQAMIDSDLAMIYGYEVKALNQQVKFEYNRVRKFARIKGLNVYKIMTFRPLIIDR